MTDEFPMTRGSVEGVEVQVLGAERSERELRDLRDWLRGERISGLTVRQADASPAEGEMGAVSDALTVIAQAGTGAAMSGALIAWLRTRRPSLKLVVQDPAGARYEFDASSTAESEAALARFLEVALISPSSAKTDDGEGSNPSP